MQSQFDTLLQQSPLIAITRGITPEEVPEIAEALLENGVRIIEVPLNSPDRPLESIRVLKQVVGDRGLCGAGTVLNTEQVHQVADAGGEFIVSPNVNSAVIKETLGLGLGSLPGCLTPTEIFAAIDAGAKHVKIFPGGDLGPVYIRSVMAVIPPGVKALVVGGVKAENIADFWAAGARGFGFGSNIYQPGDGPKKVTEKASRLAAVAKNLHP